MAPVETVSLSGEWVEVASATRRSVDLEGWRLSDEGGDMYIFSRFRLQGRAVIRFRTGVGRDRGADLYQDCRVHVWDNRSGSATWRSDRGRLIDVFSWDGRYDGRNDGGRHGGVRGGRR